MINIMMGIRKIPKPTKIPFLVLGIVTKSANFPSKNSSNNRLSSSFGGSFKALNIR